jgi:hypothetical protein
MGEVDRVTEEVIKALKQEVEQLRRLVAFYQGEGPGHALEREYRKLADIPAEKRTDAEIKRLIVLARVLSRAVDIQDAAFQKAMDDSVSEIEAEVEKEMRR